MNDMPDRDLEPRDPMNIPEQDSEDRYGYERPLETYTADAMALQVNHDFPLLTRIRAAITRYKESDRSEPSIAYALLEESAERLAMLENAQVSLMAISDTIKDAKESIEKTTYGGCRD